MLQTLQNNEGIIHVPLWCLTCELLLWIPTDLQQVQNRRSHTPQSVWWHFPAIWWEVGKASMPGGETQESDVSCVYMVAQHIVRCITSTATRLLNNLEWRSVLLTCVVVCTSEWTCQTLMWTNGLISGAFHLFTIHLSEFSSLVGKKKRKKER